VRAPHVERRLQAWGSPRVRDSSLAQAPIVNPSSGVSIEPLRPGKGDLSLDARRVLVEIPTTFSTMLEREPDAALEWRLATREIFQHYLRRGYRVVDFFLGRESARGHYLLARTDAA